MTILSSFRRHSTTSSAVAKQGDEEATATNTTTMNRRSSASVDRLLHKGNNNGGSSHLMSVDEGTETASSRSGGDYYNSSNEFSSTRELSMQFQNKIRTASRRSSSIALQAKLEELDVNLSKLHFSATELVGREQEVEQLHSVLREYREQEETPKSRLISISGISGTGKTILARQLKAPVIKAGGYFCLGKFDLNANRAQPYMAFATASHELADQILDLEESKMTALKKKIRAALGDQGIHLVSEVFPGLSRVVEASVTSEVIHASIEQKTNQLQFTVRQLIRVLSHHQESPFCLVLDDVQWADPQSLNLVEALLMDREASFMLIATSRSNELSDDHPFMKKVQSFRQESQVQVSELSIENLTEAAVKSVVANAMRESEEFVKGLAEVVFEKTLGNAFFVVQFMNMLVTEDLLTFNLGLMKWVWEDGAIEALSVADNVGSLLADKIQKLPESAQTLLKTASCLGQTFQEETLTGALASLVEDELLEPTAVDDVLTELEQCVDGGLLERSGTKYTFVHDQVQAASFRLVPDEALPYLQLAIGRGLLKQSREGHLDNDLFLAVDLCNSGLFLISDDEARIGLATQNLKAAEKAVHKSSAFDAGIAYAKSGFKCLEAVATEDDLVKYLNLKLNVVLAEASFCIGDIAATEEFSEKVIASDYPFSDRFVGYTTKMLMQFAQEQLDESAKTALSILRKLGYCKNLPLRPSLFRLLYEIFKTKNLMKKYTEDDLLNLPQMTDENRIRGMNILYRTLSATFSANPELFIILTLIGMRWTVKHGVCKYSPPMIAVYGLVVCGLLEDFDNGKMIGEVALALSERLHAVQTCALTTSTVFAFIKHWKMDMRTARKPLEYGYMTGLQMGDVNNGIVNLVALDQNSVMTGHHDLDELESIIRESVSRIRSFGQEYFAVEHCITWQLVLNLRGECDDPLIMTGEAMNQEEFIKEALETNHKMVNAAIASFGGMLGYLYENHEHAVNNMKLVKKEDCLGYVTLPRHFSFLALAYLALALEGKNVRKNLKEAKTIAKMLKKWIDAGNPNIPHFMCLIEAEMAAVTAPDTAAPMFETAVRVATRAGYRHDKAVAHARAAHFFFYIKKDDHWGSYHIDKAIQAYIDWGAIGVAKRLAHNYVVSEKSCRFSQEIRMSAGTRDVVETLSASLHFDRAELTCTSSQRDFIKDNETPGPGDPLR